MSSNTNEFAADLPRFHRALAAWYRQYGRHALPWRKADAYSIYISEIMLQQTQVGTVLERYYGPFLKRFPTLASLGEAPKEAVVKQWEGLGYYTRAANLHKAAQQCGGRLPETAEALMTLPGIGRNTAHAVACFGFKAKLPVMEANVRRVLARVFALKALDEALLWEKAALLLDKENAFDYNQAMMDIGALVCIRRNPRCSECPLAIICKGKTSPESYPQPVRKKQTPTRRRIIVVLADEQGRYYLKRRDTRFLGGLYGFMEYEREAPEVKSLRRSQLIGALKQVYSHFTLQADVYLVKKKTLPTNGKHATLAEMKQLPLSRADHKVVNLIKQRAKE